MSVPKGHRTLSDMEFWKTADSINREIREIVTRDFGIKRTTRSPQDLTKVYKMEHQDKDAMLQICEKYGIASVEQTYPQWKIKRYRDRLMDLCSDIKADIRCANNVFPVYIEEYIDRRRYQDQAIRKCGVLYDELIDIKRDLHINANKYMSLIGLIIEQVKLLKGWRKSENKIARGIISRTRSQTDLQETKKEQIQDQVPSKNR